MRLSAAHAVRATRLPPPPLKPSAHGIIEKMLLKESISTFRDPKFVHAEGVDPGKGVFGVDEFCVRVRNLLLAE